MTPEKIESYESREQSRATYFLDRLINPVIPSRILSLERFDCEHYIQQLRLGLIKYLKTADELQALIDQRLG